MNVEQAPRTEVTRARLEDLVIEEEYRVTTIRRKTGNREMDDMLTKRDQRMADYCTAVINDAFDVMNKDIDPQTMFASEKDGGMSALAKAAFVYLYEHRSTMKMPILEKTFFCNPADTSIKLQYRPYATAFQSFLTAQRRENSENPLNEARRYNKKLELIAAASSGFEWLQVIEGSLSNASQSQKDNRKNIGISTLGKFEKPSQEEMRPVGYKFDLSGIKKEHRDLQDNNSIRLNNDFNEKSRKIIGIAMELFPEFENVGQINEGITVDIRVFSERVMYYWTGNSTIDKKNISQVIAIVKHLDSIIKSINYDIPVSLIMMRESFSYAVARYARSNKKEFIQAVPKFLKAEERWLERLLKSCRYFSGTPKYWKVE